MDINRERKATVCISNVERMCKEDTPFPALEMLPNRICSGVRLHGASGTAQHPSGQVHQGAARSSLGEATKSCFCLEEMQLLEKYFPQNSRECLSEAKGEKSI